MTKPEFEDQLRRVARRNYGDDDLNIDPTAPISAAEDGAWVQAWVWVGYADAGVRPDTVIAEE